MEIDELKEILKDITEYNNRIDGLMKDYYAEKEFTSKKHLGTPATYTIIAQKTLKESGSKLIIGLVL